LVSLPPVIIGIGTFRPLTPRIPQDLSYGLYIYGWPIGQLIVFWAIESNVQLAAWQLFSLNLVIALVMAFLSWNVIERPALGLKKFVDRRFDKQ
jgi:peptidoglycan/LPS O-acetylase OafA/YrhL